MSTIFVVHPPRGRARRGSAYRIDFSRLVALVDGTAITSLADSEQFIEFGLSERMNMRIESETGAPLKISLFSTLNPDDVPPVRLHLINKDEEPAAWLVEKRLHSLRQVYAITFLLDADRGAELAAALLKEPTLDLEQALLRPDEQLYLQEAGSGSWWVVALTKAKGAPQKALNGLSLFYGEGRSLLLDRVRAGTQIKQQEAERQRDQRLIELAKALDKVKDPNGKAAIQQRLVAEMSSANPVLAAPSIAGLLPAPEEKKRKKHG